MCARPSAPSGLTRADVPANGHANDGTPDDRKDPEEVRPPEGPPGAVKEEPEEVGCDGKAEADPAPPPAPTKPGVRVNMTPLELEGLWNLLGKLEELPEHKKCVPEGIHDAQALLQDIRVGPPL